MAGEGGSRPYWPAHMGVNLSNGNFHKVLGSGSCVTCGGGKSLAYPNPRSPAREPISKVRMGGPEGRNVIAKGAALESGRATGPRPVGPAIKPS